MSRAARVTFRVAFFGRIRFSPNYHKECQLNGKKVIMGEELTTIIQKHMVFFNIEKLLYPCLI